MKDGDNILIKYPHALEGCTGVVQYMAVDDSGDAIVNIRLDEENYIEEVVSRELMNKILFYKKDTTVTGAIIVPSSLSEIHQRTKSMFRWSRKKLVKLMIDTDIFDVGGVKFSMNPVNL